MSAASLWIGLAAAALTGCVGVGLGQLGPKSSTGEAHYGTVLYDVYDGHVAPEGKAFAVTEARYAGPVGMTLGYQGGVSSAKIPNHDSQTGYAGEWRLDIATHGFGFHTSYSQESAVFDGVNYTYGGWAVGGFVQMTIGAPLLYLNIGLDRLFGTVTTDTTDPNAPSVSADGYRASGRLLATFAPMAVALELRSTWSDPAMLGTLNVTWSSVSFMFQAMYVTF